MSKSQNEKLLDALKAGRTVTRLTAMFDLGIQNITARVSDLRRLGYDVIADIHKDESGREFASYRLEVEKETNEPAKLRYGQTSFS